MRRELGLFTVSGGSDAANLRSPNLFSDLDIKSTGQLKTKPSFVLMISFQQNNNQQKLYMWHPSNCG